MQPTAFDFSDIFTRNDEWPRIPKPVPAPWAGFLRWSSDAGNLEAFRAWPPYTFEDNLDGYVDRPRPGGGQRPRRRR